MGETGEGSRSEVRGCWNFESRTSNRAFLASLALHAPRSVLLADFLSILLKLTSLPLWSIRAHGNSGKKVLPRSRRSPFSQHDLEDVPMSMHRRPTVPLQQAVLLLAPLVAPAQNSKPVGSRPLPTTPAPRQSSRACSSYSCWHPLTPPAFVTAYFDFT